jgi:hypothetical protein
MVFRISNGCTASNLMYNNIPLGSGLPAVLCGQPIIPHIMVNAAPTVIAGISAIACVCGETLFFPTVRRL